MNNLPPPALPHPQRRAPAARGVAIQGCLILLASLALITTFAMYNADKVSFHMMVAVLASLGCTYMTVKNRIPEAAAFAAVALPALISAGLGYTERFSGDDLKGVSGWIYIAGCVLYVINMVRVGLKNELPGKDEAPEPPGID